MAAILDFGIFVIFGGKSHATLAVSVPTHYKMALWKAEDVLMKIDMFIRLLQHSTIEILIKMLAAILDFFCFGGKRLVNE